MVNILLLIKGNGGFCSFFSEVSNQALTYFARVIKEIYFPFNIK
ncbi:hypothetical protein FBY13_10911 [Pantoea sp. SJZ147]|nr:hypothetical protein FBY13_10911 [Pantoea sp. SJZ147]